MRIRARTHTHTAAFSVLSLLHCRGLFGPSEGRYCYYVCIPCALHLGRLPSWSLAQHVSSLIPLALRLRHHVSSPLATPCHSLHLLLHGSTISTETPAPSPPSPPPLLQRHVEALEHPHNLDAYLPHTGPTVGCERTAPCGASFVTCCLLIFAPV